MMTFDRPSWSVLDAGNDAKAPSRLETITMTT